MSQLDPFYQCAQSICYIEPFAYNVEDWEDPDATPICVCVCLAEALHFGDLDDPDSEVSKLIRENETVRLQDELGTDPSVYCIIE